MPAKALSAQDTWYLSDDVVQPSSGRVGSQSQDVDADEYGGFCSKIGCGPGDAMLRLGVLAPAGAPNPSRPLQSFMSMGGNFAGSICLPSRETEFSYRMADRAQINLHLAAVREGSSSSLILSGVTDGIPLRFRLRGSGSAIVAAQGQCVGTTAPQTTDSPAADLIALHDQDCIASAGEPITGAGSVTMTDLDGAGRNDVGPDSGALTCPQTLQLSCGKGFCATEFWLPGPDGRVALAHETVLRGWDLDRPASFGQASMALRATVFAQKTACGTLPSAAEPLCCATDRVQP